MKQTIISFILFLIVETAIFAQVAINPDNSLPDPSAMLDVKSTSKGFLPPRMTLEQMGAILNPANGLVVFCTTNNKFYGYLAYSTAWKEISFGAGTVIPNCGTFTINHSAAGGVAPVNKTVTYGTVRNILGEPSKCWITRNLGASQQATSAIDGTEASAGWYWQFNRKQGYKHDGLNRTPNTTWITVINENSDWTATNDPCTLELGAVWRIPTVTEWSNVNVAGGWIHWNGPWNSGLKLHTASYLNASDGTRGIGDEGDYWSSTQVSSTNCGGIYFGEYYSYTGNIAKSYGFPVRCMKDN